MTVGATDSSGNVQGFSNKGPAIWAVAPGDATSYTAPLLSGTVALMLEANPGLGYRDVQAIVALTADYADGGGPWKSNAAAGFANGGGLRTSTSAGFGMVDATAAVRLAEAWSTPPRTEANMLSATVKGTGFSVPDLGTAGGTAAIGRSMLVERAVVTLDLDHTKIGDLRISLVSPSGTESFLLDRIGAGNYAGDGTFDFTLTSNQSFWEQGQGTWTLKVQDAVSGRTAQVNGWRLDLFGAPAGADDLYVYTDRFAALAGSEPGRRTLADTDGGTDGLNAAAATGASVIDLRPGANSTVAGMTLTIAAGTVIENAWGGAGGDVIVGNGAANRLWGGAGNDDLRGANGADLMEGGAGNDTLNDDGGSDTLEGGAGDDLLIGGATTADTAVFDGPAARFAIQARANGVVVVRDTTGELGADRLKSIELLAFSDGTVAAPGAAVSAVEEPPEAVAAMETGLLLGSLGGDWTLPA